MSIYTPAATLESKALRQTALGTWIALHTASPGTTGENEATGGGYVRKATVWSGGGSDGLVTGSEVILNAAAGSYTHFSVWSAVSGGTYIDGGELTDPLGAPTTVTLAAAGQVKIVPTLAEA